jgi:hypothetical protein
MLETPKAQDATKAKIPEMMTMDNQQATAIDLSWLAGIWDGEGTISVRKNHKNCQYSPRLQVVNTNPAMIRKICEIFDSLNVRYYLYEKKQSPGAVLRATRQCWALHVQTLSHGAILLNALLPYLVAKREQAILLKRFIDSRLYRRSKVSRNSDAPYSAEELTALANLVKENGDQRKSSEAIRTSANLCTSIEKLQGALPVC